MVRAFWVRAISASCAIEQEGSAGVTAPISNNERARLQALESELRQAKDELARLASQQGEAAESLRAAEEFKSRLVACSRDCIKVLDLEGRLLFMNEGGMQVLEICDIGSFLHNSWIDFWEGGDRDAARTAVQTAREGGTGRFVGYFEPRVSRQPRWWDVVVSPIRGASGTPERLLAVSRDVTHHKKDEDALREALQVNQEIIEGAAEGIIRYDSELRYQLFNPFMERLTGMKSEQVLGRVAVEVFPRLGPSGIEAALKRALEGQVVRVADVLVPKHSAGGHDVWEVCTFAPHRDALGQIVGVIGLVHDVTERHLAEETFRTIVEGTASATGADFFPVLVRSLASALRARYAYATACEDGVHAKGLAFWDGEKFGPSWEFDVTGTPCMKVVRGEVCHYSQGLQELFPHEEFLKQIDAHSYLGVPMVDVNRRVVGHIAILHNQSMALSQKSIDLVKIFAARAAAELIRQHAESDLHAALEQVRALQKKLEAENVYLQEEITKEHNFEEIVGNSRAIVEALDRVATVAPTDSTVLILGETGCGKELIARAIHSHGLRKHRPLVKVNCGAIPTGLVESELFGHMKGAFTGALERRTGRFELADGGTLFLDEVSELPLETQVKLLRVLQEHEFEPLGSSRTLRVNVRIIAASNRDLEKAVQEGRFRADLYYRLNVLPITVPPLRERRSDIPLLTAFFLERFARQFGKQIDGVAQDTMGLLARYDWPGNIRELQNVIERAVVLSKGPVLRLGNDLLPARNVAAEQVVSLSNQQSAGNAHSTLEQVEKRYILNILEQTSWVIEGDRGAAKILDLHPNTLRSRMKKLGIDRSSAKVDISPTTPNPREAAI